MPAGAPTGKDISIVSLESAASRAAFSSVSFLDSMRAPSSFLSPFSAGPMTFFSSIDILPRPCIIWLTSPFLPRAATRISSSARSSLACAIWAANFSLTEAISLMFCIRVMRFECEVFYSACALGQQVRSTGVVNMGKEAQRRAMINPFGFARVWHL